MQIFGIDKLIVPSYEWIFRVFRERYGNVYTLPESPSSNELEVAAAVAAFNNSKWLADALLEASDYARMEEQDVEVL